MADQSGQLGNQHVADPAEFHQRHDAQQRREDGQHRVVGEGGGHVGAPVAQETLDRRGDGVQPALEVHPNPLGFRGRRFVGFRGMRGHGLNLRGPAARARLDNRSG
ncbi:hypothetical protein SDC9_158850 [bioreactor metagenome]|uniref:Uncharacterized protein n=1 Tax=bioreactor metagenome TaxID=1076179 RepID=A0A645FBA4_9ZZZZ